MKICVAGLGLIGGSICMALKRAGYSADGYNRSRAPLEYALENKIIDGAAADFTRYDIVFVAFPPQAVADFITSAAFKDGAIVADICGVKRSLENKVYSSERNFFYIGTHPMAGKEVSGIENACADLFDKASMVITSNDKTDKRALETIKKLTKDMGFKYIVECSAEVHDRKIAYTSQLAHIVSNAYAKDPEIEGCIGFTGGSFQDMTRVACVDEKVWAELYLINRDNLTARIDNLISTLTEVNSFLKKGERPELEKCLKKGSAVMDDADNDCPDIKVTVLK